jgi:hypothetical protein
MKAMHFLFAAAFVLAAFLPGEAQAQAFCMTDGFGYSWDVTLSSNQFTGTVAGISSQNWYATGGRGTTARTRRSHTFTTVNPDASFDPGCGDGLGFVDWFTYNGLTGPLTGGGYPYNGTWVNSCGSSGTFTATITVGACRIGATAPVPGSPAMSPTAQASAAARVSSEGYAVSASPNPFASGAVISYTIPERADVQIIVYDALGREVARLVDEAREAGTHAVSFDASELPAGTYHYLLVAGSYTQAGQMSLVR